MTDLAMTAADRTFSIAHAGFAPRGVKAYLPSLRDLPVLVATALLSVTIIALF